MGFLVCIAAIVLASCSFQHAEGKNMSEPVYLITTNARNIPGKLQVFTTSGTSPIKQVGKQFTVGKLGNLVYTATQGSYAFSVVSQFLDPKSRTVLAVTDMNRSQPEVIKSAVFTKAIRLEGCYLTNGKMAVHLVSESVYSVYVVYSCRDANSNDNIFVARHRYNMKTNSLSAPGQDDSYELSIPSPSAIFDIKVFGHGKTEAGYAAIAYGNVGLYKLEGGEAKLQGIKAVTPILKSRAGLGPSFGGSFDSRAAAISSPNTFYTLYRQYCWLPEGANHCVFTGNVYEEVWRTNKTDNRRIGEREISQILNVGTLAVATDRNNHVLYKITKGGSTKYDAWTFESDAPVVISAAQTDLPSRGFKAIGTLPDTQSEGTDLGTA